MQFNTRKTNKKLSRKPTQTFLQRKHKHINTCQDSEHRSLLEECKSKWQWGLISHWPEWPSWKSLQMINAGVCVDKREHSYTGGNANWYKHYGEQYGDS